MGRLSAYAKNRILKLRFKKNKRIIHIVEILKRDDNIKVSRQAVSTFLKKYLETNSIYDKPRTGRKRKLTQEEIQLIGQVTRLNRDITARAIKEYLNLNVSTYTILRATKLFEWNKINPNSNDSKKAAALERQLNGESDVERRRSTSANSVKKSSKSSKKSSKTDEAKMNDDDVGGIEEIENVNEKKVVRIHTQQVDELNQESFGANHDESYEDANNTDEMTNQLDEIERIQNKLLTTSENSMVVLDQVGSKDSEISLRKSDSSKKLHKYYTSVPELEKIDLQLLEHKDLLILKNLSCSPMSFATKILFKIFKIEELHGHNVSGKTLNKNIKTKLPLDPVRIGYIKYLVESYYDEKECREMLSGAITHKQDLWKSCHTAINKSILISERKAAMNITTTSPNDSINLNATNLTSENETKTTTRKSRKSKYDAEISTSSDEDGEFEGVQTSKEKKSLKNSANATSVLARNRASHAAKNKTLNGSLNQVPQKRLRRFKSDESSSSCSSFGFGDGAFLSEEYDSCDEDGANNENSDEEIEKALKATNKSATKIRRKNSGRMKKRPNNKIFNEDTLNYETDSNEDEEEDEEDCQNEIELIQNIEKRLLNNNNSATTTNTASTSKTKATSQKLQMPKEEKISSSEASAAANIAAAMKKRIVVIGPDNGISETEIENASHISTPTATTSIVSNSQVKSRSSLTVQKKSNTSSSNNKVENNSLISSTAPAPSSSSSTDISSNTDALTSKQQPARASRATTSQIKSKASGTNHPVKVEPDSSLTQKKSIEIITKKNTTPNATSSNSTTSSSNEQRITRSSAKK